MSDEPKKPKKPKYRYIAASLPGELHCVFVVHEGSPDWYRLVATFRNAERARDYAQMENDFLGDGWGEPLAGREGDDQPASAALPAPPASALIPGQVVSRKTIEAVAAAGPAAAAKYSNSSTQSAPAPAEHAVVFAAQLDPITAKQAEVFAALLAGHATDSALKQATGFGNVHDALSALLAKGYAARSGALGSTRWCAIAVGAPTVISTQDARHGRLRADLPNPALDENAGTPATPSTEAETAVIPAQSAPEPAGPILPTSPTPPASAKGRPLDSDSGNPGSTPVAGASDEEAVTINDLSSRAKAVLKAIAQLEQVESKYFTHGNIAFLAGIEDSRVEFQIDRLRDLLCIEPIASAAAVSTIYLPTALGREIAADLPVLKSVSELRERARGAQKPKPAAKKPMAVVAPAPLSNGDDGDERLDAVAYLERKGFTVTRAAGGYFVINGARRGFSDVVTLVNDHRRAADLEALDAKQVW